MLPPSPLKPEVKRYKDQCYALIYEGQSLSRIRAGEVPIILVPGVPSTDRVPYSEVLCTNSVQPCAMYVTRSRKLATLAKELVAGGGERSGASTGRVA